MHDALFLAAALPCFLAGMCSTRNSTSGARASSLQLRSTSGSTTGSRNSS